MEYKGYKIIEKDNAVIVENIRDFDPVHIFECGQCFRWLKQQDGSYNGVVRDKAANVSLSDGKLIIGNSTAADFIELWYDYFDLGTDYGQIKEKLKKDEIMEKAIEFGGGIRFLKQDIWETLISFIISANNRIPRIMKTIEIISRTLGEKIIANGKEYYTFPGAKKLSSTGFEELEVCRGGFRCKYIAQTSGMIAQGVIKLEGLKELPTGEARNQLMRFPGVGPKVADCVLLFSGIKRDVFPTDVWVKRVMEEIYFNREASLKEIQEFAAQHFGKLAGYAQQYLFYYARENKIGAAQ